MPRVLVIFGYLRIKMKIISDFHDFYDTVMGYGHDPNFVYERKTVEEFVDHTFENCIIDQNNSTQGWNRWSPQRTKYTNWDMMCLLFCGKVYQFVKITDVDGMSRTVTYCWDVDQVRNAVVNKKDKENFNKRPKVSRWGRAYNYWELNSSDMRLLFSLAYPEDTVKIHRKYQSPVILIEENSDRFTRGRNHFKFTLNPILKDIGFFRKLDPYTTYQEIDMFMSGILGNPEMVHNPIPDDAMRDMKGFDEMSFKTYTPGERKRRRKENKKRKRGIK